MLEKTRCIESGVDKLLRILASRRDETFQRGQCYIADKTVGLDGKLHEAGGLGSS